MTLAILATLLCDGIAIGILLLFFGMRLIRRSTTLGQVALICLLLMVLLANASILRHDLSERFGEGEGQNGVSPDGLYVANAMSFRRFWDSNGARTIFFTIEPTASRGEAVKTVRFDSKEGRLPRVRELPQVVHWSTDSKEVEFRIPGVRLTMAGKGE